MSFTVEEREYFSWLDEQPQCPEGLLVRSRRGETRCVPFPSLAEFRSRRKQRFPRLERCRSLTAIYTHTLDREERENSES
jgi:hypothetical protein